MNDAEIETLFERLANESQAAPLGVGIGMGWELFREAHRRGLIVARTFTVSGTNAFPMQLPTYEGYFAHADPNLGDWDYRIGRTPDA